MHLLAESECIGYDHGANRRDKSSRNLFRNHFEADDDHQYTKRHHQFVTVDLSELLKVVPELPQGAMAATLQAQHTGDLAQRDLNTDPGQESDQHRT